MKLSLKQKIAFGLGAVGKDMVYALSAGYVLYYYQDLLGIKASFVGLILMVARVFDAVNDPFMGIVVAKTKSKWGRFRPWLFTGTILNAFVLYALFAAPKTQGTGLLVYFAVIYILWGMTYTVMDIPYWSMIPAVTDTPKDRENLSVIGRTCAGVGSAIIQVGTMLSVSAFGGGSERAGFKIVALIVGIVFIVTEVICCLAVKETHRTKMETPTVKEMFKGLFANDQALVVVIGIVLINSALYITSNLIILFFKYDLGPASGSDWVGSYTLFSTVGGAFQIIGMMVIYPLLRKKLSNTQVLRVSLLGAMIGYLIIMALCFTGLSGNLILICIPGIIVFACNGMLSVLTTVFLSNSVDYGELKIGHREESVIFSMQTFVVKLASGISVAIAGVGLDIIKFQGNSDQTGEIVQQTASAITGLRLLMTIIPIVLLFVAFFFFKKRFKLTDEVAEENSRILREKKEEAEK
ncbi:MAG: MFS transporter [Firmicutes bacterium]|nr:MFS transporter [Bacillota bacterium]MBR6236424.1 MFS transporter [Bacillota bacterium]